MEPQEIRTPADNEAGLPRHGPEGTMKNDLDIVTSIARRATVVATLLSCVAPSLATDAAGRAAAAPPSVVSLAANARPLGCLIEPDRTADLGSQVIGVVDQVRVERGDRVAAGEVLATLRSDVEDANARVAAARAQADADVLAARANLELAEQKMRRAQVLVAQNFVSEQAVDQARGELEVARQKLNQSVADRRVSQEDVRVAEAQRALRTVRSPFTGVVVERYVGAGERVEEKPMLRVAVVDPLRVELMVPTSQYGTLAPGDRVVVHPELPNAQAVSATVRTVDTVLDAASNTFRVRLSVPNPGNRLPAGLRCKADLPVTTAAASPPTPAAPAQGNAAPRPAVAARAEAPRRPAAAQVARGPSPALRVRVRLKLETEPAGADATPRAVPAPTPTL
jgi:RND family efflux transporter MFP subunit